MESLCDNDVTSSSLINLKLFGPIVDNNYKNPRLKYCLHFYGRIYSYNTGLCNDRVFNSLSGDF